jgi:hypothetical protein
MPSYGEAPDETPEELAEFEHAEIEVREDGAIDVHYPQSSFREFPPKTDDTP